MHSFENSFQLTVPVSIYAGQMLLLKGGDDSARMYDKRGALISKIKIGNKMPKLGLGRHIFTFDAATDANSSVDVDIQIKLPGKKELSD